MSYLNNWTKHKDNQDQLGNSTYLIGEFIIHCHLNSGVLEILVIKLTTMTSLRVRNSARSPDVLVKYLGNVWEDSRKEHVLCLL